MFSAFMKFNKISLQTNFEIGEILYSQKNKNLFCLNDS